jgi:hypothetical protein
LYVQKSSSGIDYDSVSSIRFNPGGTLVAAVLDIESSSNILAITVINVSDGSVKFTYTYTGINDGSIRSQGLLMDSSDNLIIGSSSNDDTWNVVKVPALTDGSTSATSIFYTILDSSENDESYCTSIIFDTLTPASTSGFFVDGSIKLDNDNTKGHYLIHLTSSG